MIDVKPRVVAVIPCYNTASHIAEVVTKCLPHVDQVIVVDDGSTDNTTIEASKAGAQVIRHERNMGYGAVIKTGFREAQIKGNDIILTIDGDGQNNPDEIPLLLEPILGGEADLVIGSRFLSNNPNMPSYRKFGIGVITSLFNLGSRTKVSDGQSGFRAYRRKIFEALSLSEKGMSVSIETLEEARKRGAIIKEVPISCLYSLPTLNLKVIRHGLRVALSVVKIRLKSSLPSFIGGKIARNQSL